MEIDYLFPRPCFGFIRQDVLTNTRINFPYPDGIVNNAYVNSNPVRSAHNHPYGSNPLEGSETRARGRGKRGNAGLFKRAMEKRTIEWKISFRGGRETITTRRRLQRVIFGGLDGSRVSKLTVAVSVRDPENLTTCFRTRITRAWIERARVGMNSAHV